MFKGIFSYLFWIMALSVLLAAGCSSSRYNEQSRYNQPEQTAYNQPRTGYEPLPSDQPPPAWAHSTEYYSVYGPRPIDRRNYGFFLFPGT